MKGLTRIYRIDFPWLEGCRVQGIVAVAFRSEVSRMFFSERVGNSWNVLPWRVVLGQSLRSFIKEIIDLWILSRVMQIRMENGFEMIISHILVEQ